MASIRSYFVYLRVLRGDRFRSATKWYEV